MEKFLQKECKVHINQLCTDGYFYRNKLIGCKAQIGTIELSTEQQKLAYSNARSEANDEKCTSSVLEKG